MDFYGKVAAFLILAAAVAWFAVDAIRQCDRRRGILFLASIVPLIALSVGYCCLARTNSTYNFKNNFGFRADWNCQGLGGGATVCGPDRPLHSTDQEPRK